MITRQNQDALLEGILDEDPVAGLTHNFYRYPARFSPSFVRATDIPLCLHRSAIGVEMEPSCQTNEPVRLIVTSPPYPGVHVLYHRWQVQGRKETPAPFWIANSLDGSGASYYTFGDRHDVTQDRYYAQVLEAFRSIAKISDRRTTVVQMIAFSRPTVQLPRYLDTMEAAGFAEVVYPRISNAKDGRIWRSVPNRKWYASQRGLIPSSNEVVLVHRKR